MKQIEIEVINIEVVSTATKKGDKHYDLVTVTYKDLTDGGKITGRKLFPFGNSQAAHAAVQKLVQGDVALVEMDKPGEYWEWISVTKSDGNASPAATVQTKGQSVSYNPDNRQLLIMRQHAMMNAVNTLGQGCSIADAVAKAEQYLNYYENGPGVDVTNTMGLDDDDGGLANMQESELEKALG